MPDETVTMRIEGDGEADEVTLPSEMLDLMREDEETDPEIVGDLALFSCAQRIHATVHHAEGGDTEQYREIEETTMDLFEDRFGATYGELTGHDH
ncbi:uncharacterized protein Nmlp_3101 [Natronomonas moolapensis 8.8.11]|uniref:Uncharacterized protein n=1 Tax=Natronomonas moolapensis (strain DSM 18674 / CECT 7526 / JCM 14361 / 8.8.11) TaxID=268739 RepID=M1XSB1_NATM8|nr:hypothetical protein [Natronomonas moolapensis]CCQ37243.1 uncharacterized protein Nmlp_3101 [Natronomonas moolapensis 8.8.11]